jgi:hypothetical protein
MHGKAACTARPDGQGVLPPLDPRRIFDQGDSGGRIPARTGWEADDQGDGAGTSANVLALFRVRDGNPAGRRRLRLRSI